MDDSSMELVRAAAFRGVHQAQVLYGQMLLDGRCVDRDPAAALHWFERSARQGNLMAINMVGRCLDQGWGVAPSGSLAEKWFRKAAEQGLDWGMYNLATLLAIGQGGVRQDKDAAFYWLQKAADLGHVKSINLLGGFYEDGWIVQRNRATARDFYRRAAIGGDFRGQFNYARFLIDEGDLLGALHWLRQVPTSATPAFLEKMREYLAAHPRPELRAFAETLTVAGPAADAETKNVSDQAQIDEMAGDCLQRSIESIKTEMEDAISSYS